MMKSNPFRPGAGHTPPYLAGRKEERQKFRHLLKQSVILENIVLTGLRGTGKTVFLDSLKSEASHRGWLWVGADLSESASIREDHIAVRICADLSSVTSGIVFEKALLPGMGFTTPSTEKEYTLNYDALIGIYESTPGLAVDKLKAVLLSAWAVLSQTGPASGIVFAYDEAQNLADHSADRQYPLALLLDTFQSIQRREIPMMLALAGLPTLFPKLVESRTFAERMFQVVSLGRLNREESEAAILKPVTGQSRPGGFDADTVSAIIKASGGYPYFIQLICREIYDALQHRNGRGKGAFPISAIEKKMDTDFFAGRWARTTDRQRELLSVIAELENCDEEFTVQEIVERSKNVLDKPFSSSHVSQMLAAMSDKGLVFKNRRGQYSFAVPLLGAFIRRQKLLALPGAANR